MLRDGLPRGQWSPRAAAPHPTLPLVTEFHTRDRDEALAHLRAGYGDLGLEPDDRAFEYAQRRLHLGPVTIDSFLATAMECHVEPLGYPLLIRVRSGRTARPRGLDEGRMHPGDVYLCARPDSGYTSVLDEAEIQVVGFDQAVLDQVAEDAPRRLGRLRLDPLSPQAAGLWNRTVDYVLALTSSQERAAGSPLVLGQAGRLLAATFLSVFDPDGEGQDRTDRADATSATVRRAVAYIESSADLDIGVADIAGACGVTARAVQLAFQRHLDTTPTAYVRRVRLERVHAELKAARPGDGVTVTGVAGRWGFARASRFSAEYRATHGQSPSETLRS